MTAWLVRAVTILQKTFHTFLTSRMQKWRLNLCTLFHLLPFDLPGLFLPLPPHPQLCLSFGPSRVVVTVCLLGIITKLMCYDTFLQHTVTVGVGSRSELYSAWHFPPLLCACSHSDSPRNLSLCYRLWLMSLLIAVLCHQDTYTLCCEHIYFPGRLEKVVNPDLSISVSDVFVCSSVRLDCSWF